MSIWISFAKGIREAFRARHLLVFGTAAVGGYSCAELQSVVGSQDGKFFVFFGFILVVGCMAASFRYLFP